MKGIDGLYTALAAIINQKEQDLHLAIDVADVIKDVKNEVDVHSASLDWYINFALRAAAEVSLYQKGYRSVVHGEGIFVSLPNCSKPEYLAHMFNNAKLSEQQKKQTVNLIAKQIKAQGVEGQLSFDLETGTVIEDVSEEQLIEMLKADAHAEAV